MSNPVLAFGQLVSVNYNGTEYYYMRNGQNDIVGLMDSTGATVVECTYDSWGKSLTISGTLATTLGANNPFRYRGYYYDTETGLYYLQTRYYDATVCRFISADMYMTTGQGIVGSNMYAYCGNNPIARYDEAGAFWHLVIGAVIGAGIGFFTSVISQRIENQDGKKPIDYGKAFIAAGAGALSGVLTASGLGIVAQVAGSAAISGASNIATQTHDISAGHQSSFNVGSMLLDGVIGGACGLIAGPGASSFKSGTGGAKTMINLGVNTVKRTGNALAHGGVKSYIREAGKAAKYYYMNTIKNTRSLFSIEVGLSQLFSSLSSFGKSLNTRLTRLS